MKKFYSIKMSAWIMAFAIFQFWVTALNAQQQLPAGLAKPPVNASVWEYKPSQVTKIPEFWELKDPSSAPTIDQFIPWLKQTFNVDPNIDFIEKNHDVDKWGLTVYRYFETYKGISLDGAMYVVGVKNGKVWYMLGQVLDHVEISEIPSITPATADANALAYAKAYYFPAKDGQSNNSFNPTLMDSH